MGTSLYIGLWLVGVAIALLWILLPFAVFGLKALLREAIHEQRRTNDLLHSVKQALLK